MTFRLKTSAARFYYNNFSSTRHKVVRIGETEFCVRPDNYVDRNLWVHGGFEKRQMETMRQAASQVDFDAFLDIGANMGLYSCIFGTDRLVPQIHAFECDPRNLYQLYGHISMNKLLERVTVHAMAVGDEAKEVSFTLAPDNNSGKSGVSDVAIENGRSITVQQDTIDQTLKLSGQTLLIKIDVEGYETAVIKGMARTLKDNRCLIQMEILEEENNPVLPLLEQAGYTSIKQIAKDHYFTNMELAL